MPESRKKEFTPAPGVSTSVIRTGLAVVLALAGIGWLVYYELFGNEFEDDGVTYQVPWMGELERWNFLIGFGLVVLGLMIAAHKSTPLGRGRGVVVGMLGCFIFGLAWIVIYYLFAGSTTTIPLISELDQYNLLVGIGFMATGFVFATRWE